MTSTGDNMYGRLICIMHPVDFFTAYPKMCHEGMTPLEMAQGIAEQMPRPWSVYIFENSMTFACSEAEARMEDF